MHDFSQECPTQAGFAWVGESCLVGWFVILKPVMGCGRSFANQNSISDRVPGRILHISRWD